MVLLSLTACTGNLSAPFGGTFVLQVRAACQRAGA